MRRLGIVAAVLFVATVFAANWAVETFGIVSVGFGLMAPAGVYFAGLAFVFRDVVQHELGRHVAAGAILAGAGLSAIVSPTLALASSIAFLVSEFVDMAVFTSLERRGLLRSAAVSNVAGAFVDSVVFLSIAFGSLAFLWGQVVGKLWMTAAAIPVLAAIRAAERRRGSWQS